MGRAPVVRTRFAAVLVICFAAAGAPPVAAQARDSASWQSFRDSILALPDSALVPDTLPGMDRKAMIEWMRRMARAPESTYVGPDRAHRPDADMARTFTMHRRDFDRLMRMFEADSMVDQLFAPGWSYYTPPSKLPARRQAAYDSMFAKLGVRMLVRQRREGVVLLRTTTVHTFDRKGYAYSRRPLTPLVTDETTGPPERMQFVVYRSLGGGWYIYFQPAS